MKIFAAILFLGLVSCAPSAGEQAERRYASAEQSNVGQGELCELARDAQFAYAADGDASKEREWAQTADLACMSQDVCSAAPLGAC